MNGRFHQPGMDARCTGQRPVSRAVAFLASVATRLSARPMASLAPNATRQPPGRESLFAPTSPPGHTEQLEPQHQPETTSTLSPREREVAALMARGRTNRQIAHELYISIATVERHASNIYNKLGLRSRTQVAVWAVEHGLALAQTG